MPIKLPKPPPPLSGLALTVVKLRLLRWCLAQNIHYQVAHEDQTAVRTLW